MICILRDINDNELFNLDKEKNILYIFVIENNDINIKRLLTVIQLIIEYYDILIINADTKRFNDKIIFKIMLIQNFFDNNKVIIMYNYD